MKDQHNSTCELIMAYREAEEDGREFLRWQNQRRQAGHLHIAIKQEKKPTLLQRLDAWWNKETMNWADSVYLGIVFVVFMAALFAAYAVGIQVLDWMFSLLN